MTEPRQITLKKGLLYFKLVISVISGHWLCLSQATLPSYATMYGAYIFLCTVHVFVYWRCFESWHCSLFRRFFTMSLIFITCTLIILWLVVAIGNW